MRRILAATSVVLFCLVYIEIALAQSTNAAVGGLVQDSSQAYIPGVTVTATNTQTGVVTTAIQTSRGRTTSRVCYRGLTGSLPSCPALKRRFLMLSNSDSRPPRGTTSRFRSALRIKPLKSQRRPPL